LNRFLSFPSPFSHSTKLTASYSMHCLQASLMSADFFSCYLSYIGQCVLLFTVLHALSFSGIPWKPNSISV